MKNLLMTTYQILVSPIVVALLLAAYYVEMKEPREKARAQRNRLKKYKPF